MTTVKPTGVVGTNLGASLTQLNYGAGYDRTIVITDEQSHDRVMKPSSKLGYILNVASYQNGVGYGSWMHIDGWSDACVRYMQEMESISQ